MKEVINWEDVSFIISSSYRKKILEAINSPKTPSQLSKNLSINKTHISRALAELESKNLIECLTPNSSKGKLYLISNYGEKLLQRIKQL